MSNAYSKIAFSNGDIMLIPLKITFCIYFQTILIILSNDSLNLLEYLYFILLQFCKLSKHLQLKFLGEIERRVFGTFDSNFDFLILILVA